jgi:hypothetical protein
MISEIRFLQMLGLIKENHLNSKVTETITSIVDSFLAPAVYTL